MCNTLPEKIKDKGVLTYQVAPRVNLDEARHWVLDPAKSKVNGFRGFTTETGAYGEVRRFTVVDAQKSLAARRHFTDQIGLITAAFYEPASPRGAGDRGGGLGTDMGDVRREDLTERTDVGVGNMIGVINVRYAGAD